MAQKHEDQRFLKFQRKVLRRLRNLESRVAILERRDTKMDSEVEEDVVSLDGLSEPQWHAKSTRGRKSNLPLEELTSRRNWMITLWEERCPAIIEGLRDARNGTEAANAVQLPESAPIKPGFLQDPQKGADQLWGFLASGRFHGNLRNLANAMAGVPEMSWKRSFDLCTANPPNPAIRMHPLAYRDFLQRNFPERLRELESARTPDDVKRVLARSRSKDPTYLAIRREPERVLDWLAAGKPI
jgi:hypothetical protein